MLHRTKQRKVATKNSFWQPGNYKYTTKRIKNGYKLCLTLHDLFEERAKIEALYSKNLRDWAKLCNAVLDKGPEYGTMRNALKGILSEAECLSEIHSRVTNRLKCGEFQELKIWQNSAYTPVFTKIEEHEKMKEQFEKAQKPYAYQLAKVERAKRKYHKSCENHRTLLNRVRYASTEVRLSPNQKKTLSTYVQKSRDEFFHRRELYEKALQNLNEYHPTYVHDMSTLFTKCQEMEAVRLTLFKSALFSVHRALNVIQDQSLSQIYEDFHKTVDDADYRTDLDWWAKNYGADMPIDLPSFEEYTDFQILASNYETVYKILSSSNHPKSEQVISNIVQVSLQEEQPKLGSLTAQTSLNQSNGEHPRSSGNGTNLDYAERGNSYDSMVTPALISHPDVDHGSLK